MRLGIGHIEMERIRPSAELGKREIICCPCFSLIFWFLDRAVNLLDLWHKAVLPRPYMCTTSRVDSEM